MIRFVLDREITLIAIAFLSSGCAWGRSVAPASVAVPAAYLSEVQNEPPRRAGDASPSERAGDSPAIEGAAEEREPQNAHAPMPMGGRLWWTAFADPALDAAIQEALHNNYFIRDVRTLIHENELNPAIPKGVLWPLQIGVPGSVQRSTTALPPALGVPGYTSTITEADIGIAASYQLDIWGQLDAQRKTFDDLIEQQRQSTEVFAQTLAEQVAQVWFEILEQRALRELLEGQVRYGRELLGIVRARFDQHLATRLAVLQQEQQLLNTQAQIPLSVAQLALLSSKLTSLLGRAPTPDANLIPQDRRLPDLPPSPAVGAPVDLIRNSPEMRFAQARVNEAEHLENQTLSNWLPRIDLVGAVGAQSFNFADTFMTSSFGVRLTWPIFDGGQRITQAQQLALTVQRRNWQYEVAFKNAVQRVQDALIQEQKQADHLRTLHAEVDLGRRVLFEARALFEQGLSDYLPVLTALANVSNLERAALQAQRLLLSYRAQLYHALGGTWSKAATTLSPTQGNPHG